MPRGSRQGKAKPVKKVKQIDTNEKRDLSGGHIDDNVISKMQYNVPKGVADDKKIIIIISGKVLKTDYTIY